MFPLFYLWIGNAYSVLYYVLHPYTFIINFDFVLFMHFELEDVRETLLKMGYARK